MTIIVTELRKPGAYYDSSKLSILLNKISGSVGTRTKNAYLVDGKISNNKLTIKIKRFSPNVQKYVPVVKNEQAILAGRISNFLNKNGVAHEIRVI